MSGEMIKVGKLEIQCLVDGAEKGDWMSTPRGSVHHFINKTDAAVRALAIMTLDVGAQYFHDVAAVVNAGGPPDRVKLIQVMAQYGLVPARPPAPANLAVEQIPADMPQRRSSTHVDQS